MWQIQLGFAGVEMREGGREGGCRRTSIPEARAAHANTQCLGAKSGGSTGTAERTPPPLASCPCGPWPIFSTWVPEQLGIDKFWGRAVFGRIEPIFHGKLNKTSGIYLGMHTATLGDTPPSDSQPRSHCLWLLGAYDNSALASQLRSEALAAPRPWKPSLTRPALNSAPRPPSTTWGLHTGLATSLQFDWELPGSPSASYVPSAMGWAPMGCSTQTGGVELNWLPWARGSWVIFHVPL